MKKTSIALVLGLVRHSAVLLHLFWQQTPAELAAHTMP